LPGRIIPAAELFAGDAEMTKLEDDIAAERIDYPCGWSFDDLNEVYVTDCGNKIYFEAGDTIEDATRCLGCGKIIREEKQ
jgi:hypothetical protein